ncbi:MAG TPA: DEAD/DEAH box helicase family protein [Dictyoglomaceae bacterium]|nr:DEAD/DEAH box helicase family protein [Dictyoglomaceae bacterium]HOL39781.1 DEAD/DEAH box helicase family protein [Dictyoglomaceae bacterium]HOP95192.1 DEAD/DEAH box helicase family protein [Dictyoglomaceae bacterium]HPP16239.1 DEAD/DEAH box helicase family protein [Dictyoglomaceae bacterium]HPU44088.1 DEAD/DEAH box helicase family protein [Dictyoglomaceae bacterium]
MSIEKYLVLNKYILSLFGVDDFRSFQEKLKDAPVGVDSDGRTHFINVLRSSFGNIQKDKLSEETLLRYDENIQSYVRKINYRREPVSLKYFQYLAVLSAEIILDNLKNRKIEFLYELNEFLKGYKEEDVKIIDEFSENDLKKLAFWMATGSGKTLIMHINYYQFFKYKLFSPDNIILITPNEGLSKQHYEELEKSGIPCKLYSGTLNGGLSTENEVLVIEITKFIEEKKGKGVTLPVDVFEGRNLIFVDEGHKGKGSEDQKWARRRDKLAENGFVFEYSATFGQILNIKSKEILKEYAKSIPFDYSYKYFYLDGYGKDFSVLNVRQEKINDQEFQEVMFVANLLSFYEQLLVYEENNRLAKEYNLEKPLWIFVGTTVTGKEAESDVIQIVDFIKKVIQDEDWLKKWVENILNGNTNLKNEDGKDIFQDRFTYLRKRGFDFEDLYKKIFNGKGSLKLYELKNAEGELGLKIGENKYFGVINIGDAPEFKKYLKEISVEQDAISGSLFDDIKREDSPINILIGSKKFIEGWDTWRVSSMGLLNIGTNQGPQIIQLFGRGVRLKGKGMSLKRSSDNPQIQLLESLNIYGIKADYLSKFLEAIRNEGVELETIEIPIKTQHEDKWNSLYTLTKREDKEFEEDNILSLEIDNKINFTIDLRPKVSVHLSKDRKEGGIETEEIKQEVERMRLSEDILDLLNWERIWQEILEFKTQRAYWNLTFNKEILKAILLSDKYNVLVLPELLEIKSLENVTLLEDIAIFVIKKYLDLFYGKYAKQFETENLCYVEIKQLPLPFISEGKQCYKVQVDKKDKDLIKEITNLTKNLDKLLIEDINGALPRIYFDGSLYVPILLQSKKIEKISPAGLVESEKEAVLKLKEYLESHRDKIRSEIYLLRNLPFSGVGFQLQWAKFYPDFIMWIKEYNRQAILFIDPKGLEYSKGLDDEKIRFCKDEIKEMEKNLGRGNITLDGFILSITPYNELIKGFGTPPSKDDFIKSHVLFLSDIDWPEILFNSV